jgi:hypothetical protein
MLDILCSCGWHESFGIIMSVCVGFLCIVYSSFRSCVVRSRKVMDFCVSVSIVNHCCTLGSYLGHCCDSHSSLDSCYLVVILVTCFLLLLPGNKT